MDRIAKALNKFTSKEKAQVKEIFNKLQSSDFKSLNAKKLKGKEDFFRVRQGSLRIIYRLEEKRIFILYVGRRGEGTYKF